MKRWIEAMGELSRGMLFLHGYVVAAPVSSHARAPAQPKPDGPVTNAPVTNAAAIEARPPAPPCPRAA